MRDRDVEAFTTKQDREHVSQTLLVVDDENPM
jgi:hypothetical protein